jgi:hypothetical protein
VFHADHTITGVRWEGRGHPASKLKLVGPALQRVIGRQFEGELRTLKGLLEGGA